MKRLIIVANRLPVRVEELDGNLTFHKSEGGLATGLASLDIEYETHWIGWPGVYPRDEEQRAQIRQELEVQDIHPVFLSEEMHELYYEGFSNSVLWPLFHYFNEYTEYKNEYWKAYRRINRLFHDHVVRHYRPGDIIWVHDYHLLLLPDMIRQSLPQAEIGFFLHIPFPSYEIFRTLPVRHELLNGIMGADLIGFHTFDYMRHFMSAHYRLTGRESKLGKVQVDDRIVEVDSFPMGINYDKFHDSTQKPAVQEKVQQFRNKFGEQKIILCVDRLDYSKGIPERLEAFREFLDTFPSWKGKVSLVMIVVPSRGGVEKYQELKTEVDELVGYINGRYSTLTWTPVHYFYRSFPFEELSALYNLADICLVTPLRDGMNLVAKEYVASHPDEDGVLILSEMAGAAVELDGALKINPTDSKGISERIHEALVMPERERRYRMQKMQKRVKRQTVEKWAGAFIQALDKTHSKRNREMQKTLNDLELEQIALAFSQSSKRLLMLDYDGTLVPFSENPADARPDDELLDILTTLGKDPDSTVVLISGRDHITLGDWLGKCGIEMVAEHGTWFKTNGHWEQVMELSDEWKPEIVEIMQEFSDKTPGAFIEEKAYSLAWHYRKTDSWLAEIRSRQLMQELIYPCTKQGLEILDGKKVIEVKTAGIDKGSAAKQYLAREEFNFILTLGDDRTDEDTFRAMPEHAWTVKIGMKETHARHRVETWKKARKLLQMITDILEPGKSEDALRRKQAS